MQTRYLSLPGEMGSISTSSTLGDVEFEEVEAVGDVAAEAAKEEGSELARSSLAGELEEEVVMVDVKLRSVLRGFLTVSAPPLVLLLLLILVGKGQVVGGEVKEGPLESIHLNVFDLTLLIYCTVFTRQEQEKESSCHWRSEWVAKEVGSQKPDHRRCNLAWGASK